MVLPAATQGSSGQTPPPSGTTAHTATAGSTPLGIAGAPTTLTSAAQPAVPALPTSWWHCLLPIFRCEDVSVSGPGAEAFPVRKSDGSPGRTPTAAPIALTTAETPADAILPGEGLGLPPGAGAAPPIQSTAFTDDTSDGSEPHAATAPTDAAPAETGHGLPPSANELTAAPTVGITSLTGGATLVGAAAAVLASPIAAMRTHPQDGGNVAERSSASANADDARTVAGDSSSGGTSNAIQQQVTVAPGAAASADSGIHGDVVAAVATLAPDGDVAAGDADAPPVVPPAPRHAVDGGQGGFGDDENSAAAVPSTGIPTATSQEQADAHSLTSTDSVHDAAPSAEAPLGAVSREAAGTEEAEIHGTDSPRSLGGSPANAATVPAPGDAALEGSEGGESPRGVSDV